MSYTKQDYERDLIIVNDDAPHGWTHSSKSTYFKLCDAGVHHITSVGWKPVDIGYMVNLRSKLCIENQVALYEANQKLVADNEELKVFKSALINIFKSSTIKQLAYDEPDTYRALCNELGLLKDLTND